MSFGRISDVLLTSVGWIHETLSTSNVETQKIKKYLMLPHITFVDVQDLRQKKNEKNDQKHEMNKRRIKCAINIQ